MRRPVLVLLALVGLAGVVLAQESPPVTSDPALDPSDAAAWLRPLQAREVAGLAEVIAPAGLEVVIWQPRNLDDPLRRESGLDATAAVALLERLDLRSEPAALGACKAGCCRVAPPAEPARHEAWPHLVCGSDDGRHLARVVVASFRDGRVEPHNPCPVETRFEGLVERTRIGSGDAVLELVTGAREALDDDDPDRWGYRWWPLDAETVLLSGFQEDDDAAIEPREMSWHDAPAPPHAVLWRLHCGAEPALGEVMRTTFESFNEAVVTADGSAMFYNTRHGIHRLDLATLEKTRVTREPKSESASWYERTGLDGRHCFATHEMLDRYLVLRRDERALHFRRGCWTGEHGSTVWDTIATMRVPLDEHALPADAEALAATIVLVERAPDGTVWVARSDRTLWRSTTPLDATHAASWQQVALLGRDGQRPERAVESMRFDPDDPRHVIAQTSAFQHEYGGLSGGELLVSEDGGASWREQPLPHDALGELVFDTLATPAPGEEEPSRHLRVRLLGSPGDTEPFPAYETHDAGDTWQPLPDETELDYSPSPWSLELPSGELLVASSDGLLVLSPDGADTARVALGE